MITLCKSHSHISHLHINSELCPYITIISLSHPWFLTDKNFFLLYNQHNFKTLITNVPILCVMCTSFYTQKCVFYEAEGEARQTE